MAHSRPHDEEHVSLFRLTMMVSDAVAQQHEWHQKDLDYRTGIHARLDAQDNAMIAVRDSVVTVKETIAEINRSLDEMRTDVASLRKHVEQLKEKMKLLAWIMLATNTVKQAIAAAITSVEWGKKVYTTITAICALLILVWEFLHSVVPAIRYSIAHHKISF